MQGSAQTHELQAQLSGQIARALAVFCVDEVVIFDDGQSKGRPNLTNGKTDDSQGTESKYTGYTDPGYFLAHLLSYVECPPHLRKALFPWHANLRFAGTLASLDMPHHLRQTEWCQYREGVILAKEEGQFESGTPVNTGLPKTIYVDNDIPEKTRVTVKFDQKDAPDPKDDKTPAAEIVAPSTPREEAGYYWGYSVRPASCLSKVLTESPFDEGYDLTIGTSERGSPLKDITSRSSMKKMPEFNHLLIVIGGIAGLEAAVKVDETLKEKGVRSPESLFDYWVDLVTGQGSRTIRTEEAVWLSLMGLRDIVRKKGVKR